MPPETVKSIDPVEFPLHNTFVTVVAADNALTGSVIETDNVDVQLELSVTVTVYTPADKFNKSSVF